MAITQTSAQYYSPIIFGAAADKLDRDMLISKIIWSGCTTAAHGLKICDYDSTVIYFEALGEANGGAELDFTGEVGGARRFPNGLKVTTMASGKLYVYLA